MTLLSLSTWFAGLFHYSPGDNIIPWNDNYGVGFSVLRDYPENGAFIPARTRSGEQDSVALLKFGYVISSVDRKKQQVPLLVSSAKASRYLLHESDRFRYNFDDTDAPTEESLIVSEASRQPVNLVDDGHFIFLITEEKFWDTRKGVHCTLDEIVGRAYTLHIDTASDKLAARGLRFKLRVQHRTGEILMKIVKWFEKSADSFFGKTVSRDARGTRFGVGIYQSYTMNDFRAIRPSPVAIEDILPKKSSKTSVPGTDLKISTPAAIIASVFLLAVFYIQYHYHYDLWGVYGFIAAYDNQTLFSVVLAIVVFLAAEIVWTMFSFPFKRFRRHGFAEIVFEFFFLPIWNFAIVTRWAVLNKKFQYEPPSSNRIREFFKN